jgi:Pregnancy-associated plasma protein-A/Secretion system C-terminal sorting domain
MRNIVLSLFAIFFAIADCSGQTGCASFMYYQREIMADPGLIKKSEDIQSFIKSRFFNNEPRTSAPGTGGSGLSVIKIPVVVHVLYNNDEQKISREQVISQIDVLNRDFRKRDPAVEQLPEHFRSLAADCYIEFSLASIDPQGLPTMGIIWKKTNSFSFGADDAIKFSERGGDNAWDADKYLNIWVGKLFTGMAGYSSAPGYAKEKDGIVLSYTAFGTNGAAVAPHHLGRTAVHETGHWLGLKHIWGDRYCGDDEISDTPPQKIATNGCPSGFIASCDNSASGSMYMNFMDLTHDACTNLFTPAQRDRMRSLFAFGGPRHSLVSTQGSVAALLPGPIVLPAETALVNSIPIFPNPASHTVVVKTGDGYDMIGDRITIQNQLGQLVMQSVIRSKTMQINISGLKSGVYFIKVGVKSKPHKLIKSDRP